MIEYEIDDKDLSALQFISFVSKVWKGNYDMEKTEKAFHETICESISEKAAGTVYCGYD